MIARHVDRIRIAERVLAAGLPIALYGHGWADIPRFATYARGPVAPGDDLRRMYQRHKVVLHINTRCNLHPRVLEAAAAGGFVLARSDGDWDFAPGGVADCLEVGRELCVFTDEADLVAKIRRAFTDEPWRQSFARAARARVHRDHNYVQRAAAMLRALELRLAEALADGAVENAA
jgi:spore maturation protein CgeB